MLRKVPSTVFALAIIPTVFAFANTASAQVVTNGLVSYWSFDEDTKDFFGKNDGKVMGDPQAVGGKIGQALEFDGDGDFLECGNDESLNFERTDAFSIQAWINMAVDANQIIIRKMVPGETYRGWLLRSRSEGSIETVLRSDWASKNLIQAATEEPVPVSEWHHVVMTYDGSSKASGVKIYVDGVDKALEFDFDGLSDTIKTKLSVNMGSRDAGQDPFGGIIDEVGVYSRVLDKDEVNQNFRAQKSNLAVSSGGKVAEVWGEIKVSR